MYLISESSLESSYERFDVFTSVDANAGDPSKLARLRSVFARCGKITGRGISTMFPHGKRGSELSAIENGMLNSRRVERLCRRRFVEAHQRQSSHPTTAIQSPDLPLARARRCAHLDKLNYKLDGSLVATRGNVVGA